MGSQINPEDRRRALRMLETGASDKEIAQRLKLGRTTVHAMFRRAALLWWRHWKKLHQMDREQWEDPLEP